MVFPAGQPKYTYEDYLQTPDNERYQLIAGDLIREPSPRPKHQTIAGELFVHLSVYLKRSKIGKVLIAPMDVHFDNENVFEPDILYIPSERKDIVNEKNIKGAPDLVVEVLSPSSSYYDLVKKKKLYAKFGVKEYWIVDHDEQTVEVHLPDEMNKTEGGRNTFILAKSFYKTGKLTSRMLPGLEIDLKEVFEA